MTYPARIKNGVAVLEPPVRLPEGAQVHVEFAAKDGEFWANKSIEDLAAEQRVGPMTSITPLKFDWPDDDSTDEFLALVREVRR